MARRTRPIWGERNTQSTEGVGPLLRRDPYQQEPYAEVDPQPKRMIVVIDEADPHANERSSYAGQYGVLYCLREDDVRDKDAFDFTPTLDGQVVGETFRWGVIGAARWNINHALTGVNFGIKQFRIRLGG